MRTIFEKNTKLFFTVMLALVLTASIITIGCNNDPEELPGLTGTVYIDGENEVGNTLTVLTGSLGGSGVISYQWQRASTQTGTFSNISGQTGETYEITTADLGNWLRVQVSRVGNSGSVHSAPFEVPGGLPITGTVSIAPGAVRFGTQLTADTSQIPIIDGVFSFQWQRAATQNAPDSDFAAVTNGFSQELSTYTPTAADVGYYIRVAVRAQGRTGTLSSSAVGPVLTAGQVAAVSASPVSGSDLFDDLEIALSTATPSAVIHFVTGNNDGIADPTTASQVFAAGGINITGNDGDTFVVKAMAVLPGWDNSGVSTFTYTIRTGNAPVLTGSISISGTPIVGEDLTADISQVGGADGTITVRWYSSDTADGTFTPLHQTGYTYTIGSADLTRFIRAYAERGAYANRLESNVLGPVINPPTWEERIIMMYPGAVALPRAHFTPAWQHAYFNPETYTAWIGTSNNPDNPGNPAGNPTVDAWAERIMYPFNETTLDGIDLNDFEAMLLVVRFSDIVNISGQTDELRINMGMRNFSNNPPNILAEISTNHHEQRPVYLEGSTFIIGVSGTDFAALVDASGTPATAGFTLANTFGGPADSVSHWSRRVNFNMKIEALMLLPTRDNFEVGLAGDEFILDPVVRYAARNADMGGGMIPGYDLLLVMGNGGNTRWVNYTFPGTLNLANFNTLVVDYVIVERPLLRSGSPMVLDFRANTGTTLLGTSQTLNAGGGTLEIPIAGATTGFNIFPPNIGSNAEYYIVRFTSMRLVNR